MTGHISTGYEIKFYGLGGGAIQKVLAYLHVFLIIFVVYTFCGALALQSVKLQRSISGSDVQDSTLESAI